MSKGLDALERLVDNKVFISLGRIQGKKQFANDVNIIEKELKEYYQLREELNTALNLNQCQTIKEWAEMMQNKLKLLDAFRNALTIEHHDYPFAEFNNPLDDDISYLAKKLYVVKQNEMDKDIKSNLREWVLKNAFPKELKELKIIKDKRVCVWAIVMARNVDEYNFSIVNEIAKPLTQEEFKLLKEVLQEHE